MASDEDHRAIFTAAIQLAQTQGRTESFDWTSPDGIEHLERCYDAANHLFNSKRPFSLKITDSSGATARVSDLYNAIPETVLPANESSAIDPTITKILAADFARSEISPGVSVKANETGRITWDDIQIDEEAVPQDAPPAGLPLGGNSPNKPRVIHRR